MKPFLVSHPQQGRLVVLGFTQGHSPKAIVAGTGLGIVEFADLTVITKGEDWPSEWPEYDRENKAWRETSAILERDRANAARIAADRSLT